MVGSYGSYTKPLAIVGGNCSVQVRGHASAGGRGRSGRSGMQRVMYMWVPN